MVLGYLIVGFVIGLKQSIKGNSKLNLQGLDKNEAIIKTIIVVFKDWHSSKEDNLWRRTLYMANSYLQPLGLSKNSIDAIVHSLGTDYYSTLMVNNDNQTGISILVSLILTHYSQHKPLNLPFKFSSSEEEFQQVFNAVKVLQSKK